MKKLNTLRITLLTFVLLVGQFVYCQLVHPGLSLKMSDLERMKYMTIAKIEPWYSSYQTMAADYRASYDYPVIGDKGSSVFSNYDPGKNTPDLEKDSRAAQYNAYMWYITGDERHAKKAVECIMGWINIKEVPHFALDASRIYILIEAAEIMRYTYSGWSAADIKKFEDMLLYPGYSSTKEPADLDNIQASFYWRAFPGEPNRAGNQESSGYRALMAIGVFTNNELMYNRAYRYVANLPHDPKDLPYPSGPRVIDKEIETTPYNISYSNKTLSTIPDYGYDGVLVNYIYETGQSAEASRDQGHSGFGINVLGHIAEIAWNQGDDIYGIESNRLLLGYEHYCKYNLSYLQTYADQTSPWEPTVASGEYVSRLHRSARTKVLAINPFQESDFTRISRGVDMNQGYWELPTNHYVGRGIVTENEAKWLLRSRDRAITKVGYEKTDNGQAYLGFGGLTFRRPNGCFGDPINGFTSNGIPNFKMNVLPSKIEAEDFDYFPISGEGKTYSDATTANSGGKYRTTEGVDIETCSTGGFNVGWIETGEYLTYTVYVPTTGMYDIAINYAAANANGKIKFLFAGADKTGEVALASTGGNQNWQDFTVKSNVALTQGVQSMKIMFSGASRSFNLNNISFTALPSSSTDKSIVLTKRNDATASLSTFNIGANKGDLFFKTTNSFDVNQQWVEIDRGSGYYSYQKKNTDFCLDGGNGGANGQEVYLYTCSSTNQNQQWKKVLVTGSSFRLEKRNATAYALEGNKTAALGFNLYLQTISTTNQNQQWTFTSTDVVLANEDFLNLGEIFEVYPVPVSSTLTIESSSVINGTVDLFDNSGKLIFTKALEGDKILDLSTLSKGAYVLKFTNEEGTIVKKIIKN